MLNTIASRRAPVQSPDHPLRLLEVEHLLRIFRRLLDEGAFVEQAGVHDALLGQVLDHHVEEFHRVGGDICVGQEGAEGFPDGGAVKGH